MAYITGTGPNSRTTLVEIRNGSRSWEVDTVTRYHSEIKGLQVLLNSKGYSTGGTDGIYGNATAEAVKSIQRAWGLVADGYYGRGTNTQLEQRWGAIVDQGPEGGGTGTNPDTYGTVINGRLYCRKSPVSGYDYWGLFDDGARIPIWYYNSTWHRTIWNNDSSKVGYVMASYVDTSGGSGGVTGNYTALVCQGDTRSASDCIIANNKLKAQYGSNAVAIRGFSTSSNTPHNPCANVTDFRSAKDYDVLYWSGHGSSTPRLNVGGTHGPSFESYGNANSYWAGVSNKLKVPIFSACHQLNGSTVRSNWAKVMRKTNIRAICGYHDTSPIDPYDDRIATAFFNYCKEGSTGNSVMYSWKNANTPNNGGNYCLLVYQDNDRCYYRLPGFSTVTYPDPDRNNTRIFAYASFISGGQVVNSAGYSTNNAIAEMPYELEIVTPTVKVRNNGFDEPEVRFSMVKDESTGATFTSYGEFSTKPVDVQETVSCNMTFASMAFGDELLREAKIITYNDVMMEVFDDGTEDTPVVIGNTTQFYNTFNGIPLEQNCIVVSSDANGVNALTNQWQDVAPLTNTKRIRREPVDAQSLATRLAASDDTASSISSMDYVYILKEGRYVLQRDVRLQNGDRHFIDCLTNEID